jgi:hypothetical protein
MKFTSLQRKDAPTTLPVRIARFARTVRLEDICGRNLVLLTIKFPETLNPTRYHIRSPKILMDAVTSQFKIRE